MKFSISRHEKFQMGCMLLANILCLFLYGNSSTGPVTPTLEFLVAFVAFLWMLVFTSEAINIILFSAKSRAEEEASRIKSDWEKGCAEDSGTLPPPRQAHRLQVLTDLATLLNEMRHQVRTTTRAPFHSCSSTHRKYPSHIAASACIRVDARQLRWPNFTETPTAKGSKKRLTKGARTVGH